MMNGSADLEESAAYANRMLCDNKLVETDTLKAVRRLYEKLLLLQGLYECVSDAQNVISEHRQTVAGRLNSIGGQQALAAKNVERMEPEKGKFLSQEIEDFISSVEDAATRLLGLECDAATAVNRFPIGADVVSRFEGTRVRLTECARRMSAFFDADGFVLLKSAKRVRQHFAAVDKMAHEVLGANFIEVFDGYGGDYVHVRDSWCGDSSSNVVGNLLKYGDAILQKARSKLSIVLETQPKLATLNNSCINKTKCFPDWIALGHWHHEIIGSAFLDGHAITIESPRVVPFPFSRSVSYQDVRSLAILILRLLYALPVGRFDIQVIDPENYGDCVLKFCGGIAKNENLLHIATDSGESSESLRKFDSYIGGLITDKLMGDSWAVYNKKQPNEPLSYRLLIVDSLAGVDSRGLLSLKKVMSTGSRAGVLVAMSAHAIESCSEYVKAGNREVGAILENKLVSLEDLIAGNVNE